MFSICSCNEKDSPSVTRLQDAESLSDATGARARTLDALRLRIGQIERRGLHRAAGSRRLDFGIDAIDAILPQGELAGGMLHEVLGEGADSEHTTVPSLLVGSLLARMATIRMGQAGQAQGQVLWAMRGHDLYAPALAAVGLHPDRLILVECGGAVLDVMEEALRHPGLLGVVGEIDGRLGLTASRRLQLAAETSGVIGFAIRRSRRFDDPALAAPSAAASRWRVGVLPRPMARPAGSPVGGNARRPAHAPEPMLGPALWRLELMRCRGIGVPIGLPTHWILESCHETGRLSLAAALVDRPAARHGSRDAPRPRDAPGPCDATGLRIA